MEHHKLNEKIYRQLNVIWWFHKHIQLIILYIVLFQAAQNPEHKIEF